MVPQPHALARLIDAAKTANSWSDVDVATRARAKGHALSKSNISRIRSEDPPLASITRTAILGLADGLGVSVEQVATAALDSMGVTIPRFDTMTPEQAVRLDPGLAAKDKRVLLLLLGQLREGGTSQGATDADLPVRSDPPATPQGTQDEARAREKTRQAHSLATPTRKPQDLTANAHPHGPDRWPDGEPVYDEHWDQWKAWQEAGALPGAWEAFRAAERQQAYDLAARFIPGPTDKERMTAAQDQAAEAPHAESGDDPA